MTYLIQYLLLFKNKTLLKWLYKNKFESDDLSLRQTGSPFLMQLEYEYIFFALHMSILHMNHQSCLWKSLSSVIRFR